MNQLSAAYWVLDHLHALSPHLGDNGRDVHYILLSSLLQSNVNGNQCACPPHTSTAERVRWLTSYLAVKQPNRMYFNRTLFPAFQEHVSSHHHACEKSIKNPLQDTWWFDEQIEKSSPKVKKSLKLCKGYSVFAKESLQIWWSAVTWPLKIKTMHSQCTCSHPAHAHANSDLQCTSVGPRESFIWAFIRQR